MDNKPFCTDNSSLLGALMFSNYYYTFLWEMGFVDALSKGYKTASI